MSVSPGAQTLHRLSANDKPGFSASAALQRRAAETERGQGSLRSPHTGQRGQQLSESEASASRDLKHQDFSHSEDCGRCFCIICWIIQKKNGKPIFHLKGGII